MTTEWVIAAASDRVVLRDGKAETTFLVTNPGSAQDRVVFEVVAGDGADPAWFQAPPEPQVLVTAGGSANFLVKIAVPAGAAAGAYWFQARAYSADTAPEEGSRLSGRVAFEVAPTVPPKRKPWWPWALAGGLVLIVAVVVGVLVFSRRGEPQAQPTPPPTSAPPSPQLTFVVPTLRTRLPVLVPVLLAPADGAVFDVYPRTTTFRWQPVPGATGYRIQIQYCQPPACTEENAAPWKLQTVTGTSYVDSGFVGAQPGRWRVTPVVPSGFGVSSVWRQFRYTR